MARRHTDRPAHEVQPEAWYWSNGVRWRHPYVTRFLPGQNVWMQASRYDLGGDLGDDLGDDLGQAVGGLGGSINNLMN